MTRQVSPSMTEYRCPLCGDVKVSFFPLNHKHDGQWVAWEPTVQQSETPVPAKRGPGRPRKVVER